MSLRSNKLLKICPTSNWYSRVCLSIQWKTSQNRIHRMVTDAFFWKSKLDVNHKDWIKTNNKLSNLELCTHSENIKHSYRELWHKSYNKWRKWIISIFSKKVTQYKIDWTPIHAWNFLWKHPWHISKCCKWKNKTAYWFIWKYTNI